MYINIKPFVGELNDKKSKKYSIEIFFKKNTFEEYLDYLHISKENISIHQKKPLKSGWYFLLDDIEKANLYHSKISLPTILSMILACVDFFIDHKICFEIKNTTFKELAHAHLLERFFQEVEKSIEDAELFIIKTQYFRNNNLFLNTPIIRTLYKTIYTNTLHDDGVIGFQNILTYLQKNAIELCAPFTFFMYGIIRNGSIFKHLCTNNKIKESIFLYTENHIQSLLTLRKEHALLDGEDVLPRASKLLARAFTMSLYLDLEKHYTGKLPHPLCDLNVYTLDKKYRDKEYLYCIDEDTHIDNLIFLLRLQGNPVTILLKKQGIISYECSIIDNITIISYSFLQELFLCPKILIFLAQKKCILLQNEYNVCYLHTLSHWLNELSIEYSLYMPEITSPFRKQVLFNMCVSNHPLESTHSKHTESLLGRLPSPTSEYIFYYVDAWSLNLKKDFKFFLNYVISCVTEINKENKQKICLLLQIKESKNYDFFSHDLLKKFSIILENTASIISEQTEESRLSLIIEEDKPLSEKIYLMRTPLVQKEVFMSSEAYWFSLLLSGKYPFLWTRYNTFYLHSDINCLFAEPFSACAEDIECEAQKIPNMIRIHNPIIPSDIFLSDYPKIYQAFCEKIKTWISHPLTPADPAPIITTASKQSPIKSTKNTIYIKPFAVLNCINFYTKKSYLKKHKNTDYLSKMKDDDVLVQLHCKDTIFELYRSVRTENITYPTCYYISHRTNGNITHFDTSSIPFKDLPHFTIGEPIIFLANFLDALCAMNIWIHVSKHQNYSIILSIILHKITELSHAHNTKKYQKYLEYLSCCTGLPAGLSMIIESIFLEKKDLCSNLADLSYLSISPTIYQACLVALGKKPSSLALFTQSLKLLKEKMPETVKIQKNESDFALGMQALSILDYSPFKTHTGRHIVLCIIPAGYGDITFSRQFINVLSTKVDPKNIIWICLFHSKTKMQNIPPEFFDTDSKDITYIKERFSKNNFFLNPDVIIPYLLGSTVWVGPTCLHLNPMQINTLENLAAQVHQFIFYDCPIKTLEKSYASIYGKYKEMFHSGLGYGGIFFNEAQKLSATLDYSEVPVLAALGIRSAPFLHDYNKTSSLYSGYWARETHHTHPSNLFSSTFFISLCIYIELLKNSNKNIDILVPYEISKDAYKSLNDFLISMFPTLSDNYSIRICNHLSDIILLEIDAIKPCISIICYGTLSKAQMLTLQKASNPLTAATGDQSIMEALDSKIPIYQVLNWKAETRDHLIRIAQELGFNELVEWWYLTSNYTHRTVPIKEKDLIEFYKPFISITARFYNEHCEQLKLQTKTLLSHLIEHYNLEKKMGSWIEEMLIKPYASKSYCTKAMITEDEGIAKDNEKATVAFISYREQGPLTPSTALECFIEYDYQNNLLTIPKINPKGIINIQELLDTCVKKPRDYIKNIELIVQVCEHNIPFVTGNKSAFFYSLSFFICRFIHAYRNNISLGNIEFLSRFDNEILLKYWLDAPPSLLVLCKKIAALLGTKPLLSWGHPLTVADIVLILRTLKKPFWDEYVESTGLGINFYPKSCFYVTALFFSMYSAYFDFNWGFREQVKHEILSQIVQLSEQIMILDPSFFMGDKPECILDITHTASASTDIISSDEKTPFMAAAKPGIECSPLTENLPLATSEKIPVVESILSDTIESPPKIVIMTVQVKKTHGDLQNAKKLIACINNSSRYSLPIYWIVFSDNPPDYLELIKKDIKQLWVFPCNVFSGLMTSEIQSILKGAHLYHSATAHHIPLDVHEALTYCVSGTTIITEYDALYSQPSIPTRIIKTGLSGGGVYINEPEYHNTLIKRLKKLTPHAENYYYAYFNTSFTSDNAFIDPITHFLITFAHCDFKNHTRYTMIGNCKLKDYKSIIKEYCGEFIASVKYIEIKIDVDDHQLELIRTKTIISGKGSVNITYINPFVVAVSPSICDTLNNIDGSFVGSTGDHSLLTCILANKIPIYQTFPWKEHLFLSLIALCEQLNLFHLRNFFNKQRFIKKTDSDMADKYKTAMELAGFLNSYEKEMRTEMLTLSSYITTQLDLSKTIKSIIEPLCVISPAAHIPPKLGFFATLKEPKTDAEVTKKKVYVP